MITVDKKQNKVAKENFLKFTVQKWIALLLQFYAILQYLFIKANALKLMGFCIK